MNLIIYGIQSIVAHGLLTIADKLNFIGKVDIVNSEEDLQLAVDQSVPLILIASFEQCFSSIYLKQLLHTHKHIKHILVADLYRLKNEKVEINLDVADIIICKECKEYEFIHALWAAKETDKYFCSEILNYILYKPDSDHLANDILLVLTEREIEVLKLIGKGYTSIQIAEELFISKHTVNSHRKRIMQKLNLQKPSQLVQLSANI